MSLSNHLQHRRAEDSAKDRLKQLKDQAIRDLKDMKRYSAQDYADALKPILVMEGVEIGPCIQTRLRLPAAVRFSASPSSSFWLGVNALVKDGEDSDGYFRPLKTIITCNGYRPVVHSVGNGAFQITFELSK